MGGDISCRVRTLILVVLMVMRIVIGESSATDPASSFRDCYTKCFLFCMIEPSQTLCSCTTTCLKECIFPTATSSMNMNSHQDESLGFCKLGCASSLCYNISTKLNPHGQNMESCVGSCSNKCTIGYSSSSP